MTEIYSAICKVTEELSKTGVAKTRKNLQQGYNFRGIDDIYAALAPQLAKHKVCILPDVLERSWEERATARGNAIFYVTVRVRFDFVSAEDGSKHEVVTIGEAMDTADKATNKAMSAAYKYAAMMVFCIPTIGEDAETESHETRVRQPPRPLPRDAINGAEIREPGTIPFRPSPGAVPFRPPPSPPPHDPETGEITPHTIPLEVTDRGPDFVRWGGLLIAGVKTASTFAETKEWEKLNVDAMRMADGTKALKSVVANFERMYARFESDVVGEEDAETILNYKTILN